MKRLAFFIAFMTLGTVGLIQLLVTEPRGPSPESRATQEATNVLNMDDVSVRQLHGDQVRWELQARNAVYNENTNTGRLREVNFRIFDKRPSPDARPVFTGRSAQALLAAQPGNLVLQGAVVLSKGDALEIRSERIEYDAAREIVTSPGQVTVRTPQGTQEGASLRYYLADDRIEFASPVFYQ